MPNIDLFPEEDSGGTVFRDVILLALTGFVAIVLLLLPHLNPPAKADNEPTLPPGNVIVEIRWPDDLDTDVDLWVKAPGDIPVGYSNKGGVTFNLLRDDLGRHADATETNYEVPHIQSIFDELGGFVVASKLDLYAGYTQILLELASREKTTFTFRNNKYRFIGTFELRYGT